MAKPERILILDGHPNPDSLCRSLGSAYERGALESGAEVRRLVLADLQFDPVLRYGYQKRTELEPDLVRAQEALVWSQHIVIIHPVWWSSMPALLKGFIDRVFLPGFAFKYREGSVLWDKLLKGRSARLIYTNDSPDWYYRWFVGRPSVKSLKTGTLEFCGVSPVRVSAVGPVKQSSLEKRGSWMDRIERLGRDRT